MRFNRCALCVCVVRIICVRWYYDDSFSMGQNEMRLPTAVFESYLLRKFVRMHCYRSPFKEGGWMCATVCFYVCVFIFCALFFSFLLDAFQQPVK